MGQPTDSGDDSDRWTVLGVEFDDLGRLCRHLMAVSFASLCLSLLGGLFATLHATRNASSEQTPEIQAELFGPVGFPFFAAFLSGVLLICSLFGYGGWSAWKSRQVRREPAGSDRPSLFTRPRQLLAVLRADSDELDEYERRVELAAASFLVGGFLVTVLLQILGVIDLPVSTPPN